MTKRHIDTNSNWPHWSKSSVGLFHAISAMTFWGVLPIYWYALGSVDPMEVLCHRIFWAWLFLSGYLMGRGKLVTAWKQCTASWRVLGVLLLASALISANWFIYIWAIKHNHVLETSLGYFIVPIVTVLMGALILDERLHKVQWLAVALVAVAIGYQILHLGVWPWIAICLAFTFSIYALAKKKLGLDSITALWFETMLSVIPVLIFLISGGFGGQWSFGSPIDPGVTVLLVGCGLVTLIPMLFFAEATSRLNLTTMGFLQFLAPTLQFLLAVFFFGDRPDPVRLGSFVVVWCSILIFLYGQRCRIRLARAALNT